MVKIFICRIGNEIRADCTSPSKISIRSSGKISAPHGIGRTSENVFRRELKIVGRRDESLIIRVLLSFETSLSS